MLFKGCVLAVVICYHLCTHTRLPRTVASCLSATYLAVTIFRWVVGVHQTNLIRPRIGHGFCPGTLFVFPHHLKHDCVKTGEDQG